MLAITQKIRHSVNSVIRYFTIRYLSVHLKDVFTHVKRDVDSIDNAKVAAGTSVPKSISRKPKLKQNENDKTSITVNNGNGNSVRPVSAVGSRKCSASGKNKLILLHPRFYSKV